jgi:hypothetical protein
MNKFWIAAAVGIIAFIILSNFYTIDEGFPITQIAIVSMMKKPKNIDTWLDYHRYMGIRHFYIRLEDTEELIDFLKSQPDVTLEIGSSTNVNEYEDIQRRQFSTVTSALKEMSRKDDIDWLIHIDSDELLQGNLSEIEKLPKNVRTFYMKNYEAVYKNVPEAKDSCFEAKEFRDCSTPGSGCVAYANGKGGGRVESDVQCYGPHRFKSTQDKAEERLVNVKVLHFESCDFELYKQKFMRLSKKAKLDTIPFPYYIESIKAAQTNDDDKLRQVFAKYRVKK